MDKHDIEKNNFLIKSASYFSVITAICILIVKAYGWLATDSQTILASLVDAMLDISSSVINLIAVRFSMQPPDDNHRFGHDKFQDLAIFSQSIFFFASCILIFFASFKALYTQAEVINNDVGLISIYISLALTFILVSYQTYVIKQTNSAIIIADKLHYFSDFLINIAVIISLHLSSTYWFIDSSAGIIIGFYILYGATNLLRQSIRNLADEELPQKDKDRILKILSGFEEAKGVHELKTRIAGNKPFIQFHLEMDPQLSLEKAHYISEKITNAILKEFPLAEVIVHQDLAGHETNVNYREKI